MSKAKFKEKQKKLHEQRVRPTEGTEVVPAWDYDFSGANEVHQSDDFEPLESVALFIPEGKSKTREKFKKKRDKARHKLDVSVSPETASDYLASLNARDAVPPTVLVRDDIPDNVQESTLSKPASRPIFEPAIKKTSKTLSIVERAGELNKYVHIISYGNTLYYHNKYYYTQLDAKQLIKLYRKYVDYELNNESSLHGYKDLYDCFMTDPKIECNEPEDEPIYAPLKNGVFELVEWKLHPHSPDQVTFTYIKAKYAPKATCPIFEGYLHRITGGDPQLMERFWMVIGYLLIYPARGKFFIFMKGVGNSGKSVLGSFIRRLYPKESVSSIRLKNLTNQFGMASLATSVINFDMDMSSSKIDDEAASRLKQITGGDSMNIPRKYRDDALLERRIKFVFSSNHPLIIDGEDEALMKRIVYLPFNYAIQDDQQDSDLGDKIWAERDAVVTKALYYARKLVQRNYMLENSIARQKERLAKYIDLCADGVITKQELVERRKGVDEQIAELQTQYESVEQEDERSGALDMNLISQKLDEWQRASENDVNRELINSCVAQITPMTNEEFRWVLDFQLSELQGRNTAAYTMDGFIEMARFSISFEEAKAFKASRNQGIRKNEWHDLTVVVGIQSKIQR